MKTKIKSSNSLKELTKNLVNKFRTPKEQVLKDSNTEKKVDNKKKETIIMPEIRHSVVKENVIKHISNFEKVKQDLIPKNWLMVFMELNNGDNTHFFVDSSQAAFKYNGKSYVLDPLGRKYMRSMKVYYSTYHENFCLPLESKIDYKSLVDQIKRDNKAEVEYMTDPSLLEDFITSKIAENIMKGQKVEEFLNKVIVFSIVSIVIAALNFLIMIGVLAKLLSL